MWRLNKCEMCRSDSIIFLQVAEAGTLAKFLVTGSMLFPAYRTTAMSYDLIIGGKDDPTVQNAHPEQEAYILQLMQAAHDKARRLVTERRSAIEAVANEMCGTSDDTISGSRIVELVETTPLQPMIKTQQGAVRHFKDLSERLHHFALALWRQEPITHP